MNDTEEQANEQPQGRELPPTTDMASWLRRSGDQIGHFRIVREIGRGGMGVVYLAHDTRLGRPVAIKSLPPELLADVRTWSRLKREARVLASLNHPNIAAIYEELEESERATHLVLEYVPGDTLAECIARERLGLHEMLSISHQVACALVAAHDHGIIHRDLKPGNIKITPEGNVKVLDFGLAKAMEAAETQDQQSTVTQPGRVIGTPVYMSPEQARGKPTDKHTDVWSFGCVLYEMLAGRVPFEGDTGSDILASILGSEPDWGALPSETPPSIQVLLRRCLEKEVHRRLRDMGDIAITLEDSIAELRQPGSHSEPSGTAASSATGWRRHLLVWPVAGAVVGILVLSAFMAGFTLRRSSQKEKGQLGLPSAAGSIRAIAVLPFENLSGAEEQEYFVDGMTDLLSAELSKIRAITVRGQHSAARYKGADRRIPEIARELDVDGIVRGSVLKAANDVRITVRLIHGPTEEDLWADSYEGDLGDVLTLQREVALGIAKEIKITLTPQETIRLASSRRIDPQAHDAYLRGRSFWNQRSEEGLKTAIEYFKEAKALDPNYAQAYAGLADCYILQGIWDFEPSQEVFPKATREAQDALRIDDSLAEAHNSLAYATMFHDWDWSAAEREFLRAIELNPQYATAHHWYANFLGWMGRIDEALTEIARAQELEPVSLIIGSVVGDTLCLDGEYEQALEQLNKVLETDPRFLPALYHSAKANLGLSRFEENISIHEKLARIRDRDAASVASLAFAHAAAGNTSEARGLLEETLDRSDEEYVPAWIISLAYAHLEETEQALIWLQKVVDERHWAALLLKTDPLWGPLREEVGFQTILAQLNFPEIPPSETMVERKETAHVSTMHVTLLPYARIDNEALWHVALAISPGGKRLAYVDQGDGPERMLYLQELDHLEARSVPGTEGAIDPFFSPDGQWLGYSDHNRHTLEVVAIGGGNPRKLAKAVFFGGGTWLDDAIVYSPDSNDGLWSVPVDGGSPRRLTTPDSEAGETWHAWPCALPNGDILFTTYVERESVRSMQMERISLDDRVRRVLLNDAEHGRYLSSGHLVFVRNGSLFAVRFDPKRNRLAGTPIPLPQRVLYQPAIGATQFSCSETGLLAWVAAPRNARQLVWVDDRGQVEPLGADDRAYEMASVSSDDSLIAVAIAGQYSHRDVNSDIWIGEMSRGTWKRVTFDGLSTSPQWLNGSRELLYLKYSLSDPFPKLVSLDPSGRHDERIVAAQLPEFAFLGYCVHPAGTHVLSTTALPDNNQDIVSINLEDSRFSQETLVDETRLQRGPTLSPDGRWLAYSSNETGTWEVYVRSFPNPGAKIAVSRGGGYEPLWHPAGGRLYYRDGDEMWMVRYEAEAKFVPGPPEFLFDRHFYGGILADSRTYAVTEDCRFLMIQEDSVPGSRIHLTVNWFEELKELLP